MLRKVVLAIIPVLGVTAAHAGGGIGYTSTDAAGTVERVVEQRALPGERIGALVSYTRSDGSRSFVEYAVECDPLAYAYLGIASDDTSRTPNLRTVRDESARLLANDARPIETIPLGPDSAETSIRTLAQAVCS